MHQILFYFRCSGWRTPGGLKLLIQISTLKVNLFGTFSKIGGPKSGNSENQEISNCCRNRANWWISMKPCANERSRFIFSKFFWIFDFYQFFIVLQLFEHRSNPDFRKYRKYRKTPKMSYVWGFIQVGEIIFFKNFFLKLDLTSSAGKMFWLFFRLHF